MYNIAICCDNIIEIKNFTNYLDRFTLTHKFKYKLYKFKSIGDLLNSSKYNIDIIFLYTSLKNRNTPIYINKEIKTIHNDTKLIFVPEIVDFMLNGFYLKDFNYILKPIHYECFETEILACISSLGPKFSSLDNLSYLNNISPQSILFIEKSNNKSTIYSESNTYTVDYDITLIEELLDSYNFYKCNDNFLINLNKVNRINKFYVIIKNKNISVDRNKFPELKSRLLRILKII